ncbi:MAG: hypothetical protein AAF466_09345, partial [Bacteroidota bacterium]
GHSSASAAGPSPSLVLALGFSAQQSAELQAMISASISAASTTQLWQIRIVNEQDELVSLVKFTTISLPKKDQ